MGEDSASYASGGQTPLYPDDWRDDDRARTEALRARIASLVAGPDPAAASPDTALQAAVSDAVRAALAGALPALLGDLLRPVVQATVEPAVQVVEARLAVLDNAVAELSDRVAALGASWPAAPADRSPAGRPSADQPLAAGGAAVRDEFEALRGDMAAALEYVQEQLAARTDDGYARTRQAVVRLTDELRAGGLNGAGVVSPEVVLDEFRAVRSELATLRTAVADQARKLRDEITAGLAADLPRSAAGEQAGPQPGSTAAAGATAVPPKRTPAKRAPRSAAVDDPTAPAKRARASAASASRTTVKGVPPNGRTGEPPRKRPGKAAAKPTPSPDPGDTESSDTTAPAASDPQPSPRAEESGPS